MRYSLAVHKFLALSSMASVTLPNHKNRQILAIKSMKKKKRAILHQGAEIARHTISNKTLAWAIILSF
jgi:hypothetical protein